jgi:hypothetical protein
MLDVTKLDKFDETEYMLTILCLGLALAELSNIRRVTKKEIADRLEGKALTILTMMDDTRRKELLAECQKDREKNRKKYEHQDNQLQKN